LDERNRGVSVSFSLVIIAVPLFSEKTVYHTLIVNEEPNDGSGIVDLERERCAHTGKIKGGELVAALEVAVRRARLVDIASHLDITIVHP
jgi:hypothetical protein